MKEISSLVAISLWFPGHGIVWFVVFLLGVIWFTLWTGMKEDADR
jgi:hypothetical protein